MKSKTIIFLSALIVLMLGVIVAAVVYLYSEPKIVADVPAKQAVETKEEQPQPKEEPKAEEKSAEVPTPKAVEPPAPAPEAPKAQSAKKEDVKEFKVKNSGTGKDNILKQNADNSLCLIDHNGKQLWKIPFDGPVVGSVEQIDIYNNLKIQYLIAQADKLHLIDRLGREVKGFPLDLKSPATSGPIAVKSGKLVYWEISTKKGKVYFDKKTKTILNQLP